MKILGFYIFFCLPIFLFAQEKIEVEKQIKANEVSQPAKDYIQSTFEETKKIKWYLEISNDTKSHEAKFTYKKEKYSVKFDLDGAIIDIEKIIPFETIPKENNAKINSFLENNFENYNIRKIQVQYTGSKSELQSYIKKQSNKAISTKYEIEFMGKDAKNGKTLWEVLFDENGALLYQKEIILQPSNNLEF